jgi:hypothetical protein
MNIVRPKSCEIGADSIISCLKVGLEALTYPFQREGVERGWKKGRGVRGVKKKVEETGNKKKGPPQDVLRRYIV